MRSTFALLATAGAFTLGALASSAVAGIIAQAQPDGPAPASFSAVARIKSGDNCARCDLTGASLKNADLIGIDLSDSILNNADMKGAKLARANITGADLSAAKGLTQAQINLACGDAATRLPLRLHVRFCS